MRYAEPIERLARLGDDSWALYFRALAMAAEGRDVVNLTIGAPDVPAPDYLIDAAKASLDAGRTHYSPGAGEMELRETLARRYTQRVGREITPSQVLCVPGTQTGLHLALSAIAGPGERGEPDEVLVGDPMYATYGIVGAACGATLVPVPLDPANDFRIRAADIAARITPRTRAIWLNSPHNPTGAVLSADDIAEIGTLAREHDLWIMCDEVYDELVFDGVEFHSPLADPALAERTIVISAISKSHAAPGFRSGWCVGPAEFVERAVPLSNAMLFGSPPFIADATAVAVSKPSPVAQGMRGRFATRAARLGERLRADTPYRVHLPDAGMFALIDVSATGMDAARPMPTICWNARWSRSCRAARSAPHLRTGCASRSPCPTTASIWRSIVSSSTAPT